MVQVHKRNIWKKAAPHAGAYAHSTGVKKLNIVSKALKVRKETKDNHEVLGRMQQRKASKMSDLTGHEGLSAPAFSLGMQGVQIKGQASCVLSV